MSGSRDEGAPSLRYSLEDTIHELPTVTVRPGRAAGGVLSVENLRAAGYRVAVVPPDTDKRDLRTYAERPDARMAEIRRMVDGLVEMTAQLGDHVTTLALRLKGLEGRNG